MTEQIFPGQNVAQESTIYISQTKALIASAFIEYLFYGVLYLIEGAKLQEYEDDNSTPPSTPNQRVSYPKEEHKQPGADTGDDQSADPKDVHLEDGNKGTNVANQQNVGGNEIDETDDFDAMHFVPLTVKNFQKSSLWFLIAVIICAVRAATTFVLVLAYIQLLCRVLQFIGAACKKRMISRIGYALGTVVIALMLIIGLADEGHKRKF